MFVRMLTFAGGIAVAALVIPDLASSYLSRPETVAASKTGANSSVPTTTAKYASAKGVVLEGDRSGHFFGT
ncbi:MAG: TIGR02281 family clan AA aspartic protease, partial [Ensifer adhaerens]